MRVLHDLEIEQPELRSVGIEKVWVNGVVVLDGSAATGAYPGRAVTRP